MKDYLDTQVGEIRSPEILTLITELETVSQVSSVPFINLSLWHFLVQCVYPHGSAEKRQPINMKYFPMNGFLGTSIGKLAGTDVFSLCEELARRNHTSLEFNHGRKLATFFNANLPKFPAPKKPTALQQRRYNVDMLRRANRR